MSTKPTDLILEHSCIFTGPQRRLSWHQDSLICSPDYYTLTTPDAYEPLLLHHVPSPSLCLDEMLKLWPVQDKTSSSHGVERNISPPNDCRDSVATLVDFGSWVSRQSHDRRSSLLPPAPHWDRPDLEASSDSVECRLLSPGTTPEGEPNRDHWRSSSPPFSKRSATPDQLGKLCVALENSSLFSRTASPVSTRTTTPVPSLSHSHCSISTCSVVDVVSPKLLTDTNGKMSRERCHIRHDGSLQSATISCRASGFQDINPRTCSSRLEGTWSELQLVSDHVNRDLSSSLTATDFGQRTGSLYPQAMPGQVFLSTSSSDPTNHESNPEVSYIDWDDDEEEERGQHRSRLSRMKKSLTDLRNAERFISESVGRGNGMTKGYPGKTTALQSPHLGRSTIKAEFNNNSRAVALHPQHSRGQGFRKAHGHMVMVNNLSNISSSKQETMDTCRSQALSRATSARERPAVRLRNHASSKSLSSMKSDCPPPWSCHGARHGFGSSIRQSMRHRRRTISSQLEGFTPLGSLDYVTRTSSGAEDDCQSLQAIPMFPPPMDGPNRRISSRMLRWGTMGMGKAKGADKGRTKVAGVGRWARMLCGRGCLHP